MRHLLCNFSEYNMGDRLMVDALIGRIRMCDPHCEIFIPSRRLAVTHFSEESAGLSLVKLPRLISSPPASFRARLYNLKGALKKSFTTSENLDVLKEIKPDFVYDVSGYYLRSHRNPKSFRMLIDFFERAREQGAYVICMPKTFGPLDSRDLKKTAVNLVRVANLIFCRDKRSFSEIIEVSATENAVIMLSCDYTTEVLPKTQNSHLTLSGRVAIIPNVRMLDSSDSSTSESYLDFLVESTRQLLDLGRDPFILLHQPKIDMPVAESLNRCLKSKLEVVRTEDHRVLKGIISRCEFVISSRFHGIVNALSSGVPVCCAGWSHKYAELLADHDLEALLIDDLSNRAEIAKLLTRLANFDERDPKWSLVRDYKRRQIERSQDMWDRVERLIKDRATSLPI